MPTAEKERTVEQAREWYEKAAGLVFTDYRGLKVKEMQQLRSQLRAKGCDLHVVKNTLFRRAAGEAASQFPEEFHNGPTAIAFVYQNESECAKVLWDYSQAHKSLQVKGGFFNGQVFDVKGVEKLSKLPPRDVLIAQVIGTIAAPLTNLVSVIESLYAQPIRAIYAVVDKLAPAPAEVKSDEAPAVSEAAPQTVQTDQTESPESADSQESISTDSGAESAEPAPEAAKPASEEAPGASTPADAEASEGAEASEPAEEPTNPKE